MALNVDDFPEFMPEPKCDCEECEGCKQLEQIKVPLFVKIVGNIVALAFFLHILAYNIGIGFAQRKRFIIAVNEINETIELMKAIV